MAIGLGFALLPYAFGLSLVVAATPWLIGARQLAMGLFGNWTSEKRLLSGTRRFVAQKSIELA